MAFIEDKVTFDIVKHLGFAGKKQVNIVSWNEHPAKVDIREWVDNQPRRGITLTDAEAEDLYKILKGRYEVEG